MALSILEDEVGGMALRQIRPSSQRSILVLTKAEVATLRAHFGNLERA